MTMRDLVGRLCTFLIACSVVTSMQAQNSITGVVIDSATREPIPSVNVFIANSMIGAATNLEGAFEIRDIPNGKYDIVVSMVGYHTQMQSLEFTGTSVYRFDVQLVQKSIQLREIQVRADTVGWYDHYKVFWSNVIGTTANAARCRIRNPRDVHFYLDPKDRVLVGHASQPIEIENRALGYKIFFFMESFELDYKTGRMLFVGVPRYENLTPKSTAEARRWERERARAYHGSFIHFIRAVNTNALAENEFVVVPVITKPNPKRPSDEFLRKKIQYWSINSPGTIDGTDSLSRYRRLAAQPRTIDSVGQALTDARWLTPHSPDRIEFTGKLRITYKGEKEETRFRSFGPLRPYQESIAHLQGNGLRIYDNGYYEDVRDVLFEGYLGWSEKLSDFLPLEYQPPVTNKK